MTGEMGSGNEVKERSDLQRKRSKQNELPLDCLKTDTDPRSGILIYSACLIFILQYVLL